MEPTKHSYQQLALELLSSIPVRLEDYSAEVKHYAELAGVDELKLLKAVNQELKRQQKGGSHVG